MIGSTRSQPCRRCFWFNHGTGTVITPTVCGVMLFSNVNGWSRRQTVWPLWEKANELNCPLHPRLIGRRRAMTEYWLMPLVGFMMDTTLAAGACLMAHRFPQSLGARTSRRSSAYLEGVGLWHRFQKGIAPISIDPERISRVLLRFGELRRRCLTMAIAFAESIRSLSSDYPTDRKSLSPNL